MHHDTYPGIVERFFKIARWGIFHNLAHVSTDKIFMKILAQMYLWTRNSPLNFRTYLDADSISGPDLPWCRSLHSKCSCYIFTALHGMQTRSCDENSVCPSVCLSVKCVHCDKTEEKSVVIFIPCERSFSLVFWEEEWLVGGDHFYLKF